MDEPRTTLPPASGDRRRFRWPWILFAIVAAVVVAVAIVVPLVVDVEQFRGRIEAALEQATGWDAELGRIDFSVWRGMVLTVEPVHLVAPGNTSRFDVGVVQIGAALGPLFRGRLEIDRIDLVDPDIRLVRSSEREGWIVPALGTTAGPAEPAAQGADGGFAVEIRQVRVQNGRVVAEDRAADPPWTLKADEVDLRVEPTSGTITGSAQLVPRGGRISWDGTMQHGLAVEVSELATEQLAPFLGPDLFQAGGRLDGKLQVDLPASATGSLTGTGIVLLAGTEPFDTFSLDFAVSSQGDAFKLDRMDMTGDGLEVRGTGDLAPGLSLRIEVPETSIETVRAAAPSVMPLPLELEPPGTASATIHADMPAGGGALTWEAHGRLATARFVAADVLPAATDVEATFDVSRAGAMVIDVVHAVVGGGTFDGKARLDRLDPPGTLTFEGGLREAVLGRLLEGFVGDASRIVGPTGLDADVSLDLAYGEVSPRSLGGNVELSSRDVSMPGWDLDQAVRTALEQRLGPLSGLVADRLGGGAATTAEKAGQKIQELLQSLDAKVDFDVWPWRVDRLALTTGEVVAEGQGTFDPEKAVVDFRLTSRIGAEPSAALVAKADELRLLEDDRGRIVLPMTIEGPLLAPRIGVDVKAALAGRAGQKKQEVKKEVEDNLRDRLQRELENRLKKKGS